MVGILYLTKMSRKTPNRILREGSATGFPTKGKTSVATHIFSSITQNLEAHQGNRLISFSGICLHVQIQTEYRALQLQRRDHTAAFLFSLLTSRSLLDKRKTYDLHSQTYKISCSANTARPFSGEAGQMEAGQPPKL